MIEGGGGLGVGVVVSKEISEPTRRVDPLAAQVLASPMPLIMLAGVPCSGKSALAEQLRVYFEEVLGDPGRVFMVGDHVLHADRNIAYREMVEEKKLRGAIRDGVFRALNTHNLVIVDSTNAIKGFRFELWCAAREMATSSCVVYTDAPVAACQGWNAERRREYSKAHGEAHEDTADLPYYKDEIFADMASRFELPNASQRWDRPMFPVFPGEDAPCDAIAEALGLIKPRATPPVPITVDERHQSTVLRTSGESPLTGSVGRDGLRMKNPPEVSRPTFALKNLNPVLATRMPSPMRPDAMSAIDAATQGVAAIVLDRQKDWDFNAQSEPLVVTFTESEGGPARLLLNAPVNAPEMRRRRRDFMKLILTRTGVDGQSAKRIFVSYLVTLAQPNSFTPFTL